MAILAAMCVSAAPLTVFAGWEQAGGSYRYKDESGTYAVFRWVEDGGKSYYLDQNGIMAVNTTTPDGYQGAGGRQRNHSGFRTVGKESDCLSGGLQIFDRI